MNVHTPDPSRPVTVRHVLDTWLAAIHERDLRRLTALHSPGVTLFDVAGPVQFRGHQGFRRAWQPFLDALGPEGIFELHEIAVHEGDTVAVVSALVTCNPGGVPVPIEPTVRLTMAMEKHNGEWTIIHEHHSAPYDQERT